MQNTKLTKLNIKNMRKSTTDEQSPAFQFYASDWISSPDRMRMSLEEQGAYILLYCNCWRGHRILFDMEILSKMCNCRLYKINKIWPNIEHLFKKIEHDKDTYLICIQAEEERKEQLINRKKRSKAGKLGAKIRWDKLQDDKL